MGFLDVLTVNLNDDELDRLAKKTWLVISTVGPFLVYGSATCRACALNGTHYLDCTGETPWVADMIRQYDEIAKKIGSIMIPCCGFDCVPSDHSTWDAANHLLSKAGISGGTLASLLQTLNLYSLRKLYHIHAPFELSPKQPMPSVPPQQSRIWTKTLGLLRIKELGWMGYQPQGPVDRAILHRSWGLLGPTAASYGHNFDFHAWLRIWGPVPAVLWHLGLAMLVPLLLLRPVRWLLSKLWYQPGEGAGLNKIHGN
ncbi:Saccharopine dehydrogenase-domain-containing protein [Penicillium alfredii]|uniref:Saccharopine dehydrogenase-domain-containing protein n=1 Tax=Penicillium alfredii TaxID=1506179 RepID=A0A9W9ERL5_9EURO|nr:Saccharopine dehydrogenase-domain-containing protein [Penicillium alfredii]KAJ5086738.1 Saccharopine dehydrogenase-domain-containing protein [Penicillium alfredii]